MSSRPELSIVAVALITIDNASRGQYKYFKFVSATIFTNVYIYLRNSNSVAPWVSNNSFHLRRAMAIQY